MFLFINFHVSFTVSCALAQPLSASALGLSGNSVQDVLVASALPLTGSCPSSLISMTRVTLCTSLSPDTLPPLGSLLSPSCSFLCCPVCVPAQHSQQLHSKCSPSLFSPEFLLEFLDTTSQVLTSDSDFFFPGGPCSIFP